MAENNIHLRIDKESLGDALHIGVSFYICSNF